MNDVPNTFEKLVSTLESSERQEMLRQLADLTEQQNDELRTSASKNGLPKEPVVFPRSKLAEEPFLIQLWYRIRAFFTSNTPDRLYANHLVSELGQALAHSNSGYIDIKRSEYTHLFRDRLVQLLSTQKFFLPLLSAYDNEKGDFYIILGEFIIKDTCDAVMVASDPFSVPYAQDQKKDVRNFLLREMENVLQSIPEDERVRMYQAAQAIEWIRGFCNLPLDRMVMRFDSAVTVTSDSNRTCLVELISEEMKTLVNVLSSAKKIPVLLLEALFLFARQSELAGDGFDIETECRRFVSSACGHLSGIRTMKATVPLLDFVRFSLRNVAWQPSLSEAGEDWFLLFRNAWKKRFEEKWLQWNTMHRRALLEQGICILLEIGEIPALPNRPWEKMWLPLTLRRELSFSFLKEFFNRVYPTKIMRTLKILLIEGDFYKHENLAEYTDAFSTLEHMQGDIEVFENRLGTKGDIGEGFALIQKEKMATVKGKARLENLMLSTDSEVEMIINRAMAAFRSIDLILGGIIDLVRGGPYETLVNLAALQGKQNETFRKEMIHSRHLIREVSTILSDAEVIEKDSL